MEKFDVVVVGGGSTGVAVARDCAMRGFKTILVEKGDLGSGTTGTCMGMIHGGFRYLLPPHSDTQLVTEMCRESGVIQKIASHLVFRIPYLHLITKPVDEKGLEKLIKLYKFLDYFHKMKNTHPHTYLSKEDALKLEPNLNKDAFFGAFYTEEWGVDVFRLVVATALSAKKHGAEIRAYTKVIDVLREGNEVVGVKVRDVFSGRVEGIRASMVVNAAGAWAPIIARMAGVEYKLRPTKGVHVFLDRRITNFGIIAEAIDGHYLVLLPHENTMMLGDTDDDYFGDPDDVKPTFDEVEYLLRSMERFVPKIRDARVIRAMAGLRPLLYRWGVPESDITRRDEIVDHEERDGLKGFITIGGGKMVTMRLIGEKVTDLICKKFGVREKCRTRDEPLPGAEKEVDVLELARKYGLPPRAVERIVHRHGSRAERILKYTKDKPEWKSTICTCEPVIEAEIRYVLREEFARTIDDIKRRTRLGMGPCQGCFCTFKVAHIVSDELELPVKEIHKLILDFLRERWKGKQSVLRCYQMGQEELAQSIYMMVANYDHLIDVVE
ncbi:MAG: FAD-dependent oxidoreductase [Candidatus Baldrarchaeia archaeon]